MFKIMLKMSLFWAPKSSLTSARIWQLQVKSHQKLKLPTNQTVVVKMVQDFPKLSKEARRQTQGSPRQLQDSSGLLQQGSKMS